jgi:hypothetical protein
MVEENSEIASVRVSSMYRRSDNKSVFMSRKLSLGNISEEESENPVDGKREDEKQLNIITKEGNDNFVSDNQKMSDNVELNEMENIYQSPLNIRFIPEMMEHNKPTSLQVFIFLILQFYNKSPYELFNFPFYYYYIFLFIFQGGGGIQLTDSMIECRCYLRYVLSPKEVKSLFPFLMFVVFKILDS